MSYNQDVNNEEIKALMLKYEYALEILKTQINFMIKEYERVNKYNPVEHIKSRIKTESSALRKLESKNYELTIGNIINHVHDMVGIRIVCSFISDVYELVKVIKSSELFEIKEERDYIKNPKESGYISYHLLVWVPVHINGTIEKIEAEIQIRTIAMDFWASLDHKIQYKFPNDIPKEIGDEMYNCSMDIKALDNKMYMLNEIVQKYKD